VKKLATIFLFFLYGFSASGTVLRIHYCMNKYVHWSLSIGADGRCENCGMKKGVSKRCCHDEYTQIKNNDAHQAATASYKMTDWKLISLPELSFIYLKTVTLPERSKHLKASSPPPLYWLKLNISNCVFLI
jgi:hypothetical protein